MTLPPPAWALSRVGLLVALTPHCDAAALPSDGVDSRVDALRGAARSVAWPERALRWAPGGGAALPHALTLACSLLAAAPGAADERVELAARLQAACAQLACAVTVAPFTALFPLPVLSRTRQQLTLPCGPPPTQTSAALALLRGTGVALQPEALSPLDLEWLRALAADRLAAAEAALRSAPHALEPFRDDCAFADVASRGRGRLELRLPLVGGGDAARLILLAAAGPWAPVARAALRDATPAVTASVIVSVPGATAQAWHADGPHDETLVSDVWAADAAAARRVDDGDDPDSWPSCAPPAPPSALCVFLPLVDVTPALGATHFWLGSHAAPGHVEVARAALDGAALAADPDPGGDGAAAAAPVLRAHVRAGCALLYDYRLVHRGGANSGGGARPVLQLVHRRADGAFVENANFGAAPLLACDDSGGGWEVLLPAVEGAAADVAAGEADAAAWAAARDAVLAAVAPPPPLPPPLPPSAGAGDAWALFD